MPPDLSCVVERERPYAIIRLSGVLHGGSALVVRAALAKCLAAQPTAIVVELSELRIGDAAALSVLAAGARNAAQWPGVPLVLCGMDPSTENVLSRSSVCRYIPVFPTLEAAMAGIEDEVDPVELSTELLPVVGAARQARELVTEACARWELTDLVGPACTIVTELVNNVVVHAQTPMRVTLRLRDRHFNIAVRDDSASAPEARGPAHPTAPGGRGLMMVDAVAQTWGYMPLADGKVVWAVLLTDPAAAR